MITLGYIRMNALNYIQDGGQIHPDIYTIDAILKILYRIKEIQSEWKGA